jgi:hypothetical protein
VRVVECLLKRAAVLPARLTALPRRLADLIAACDLVAVVRDEALDVGQRVVAELGQDVARVRLSWSELPVVVVLAGLGVGEASVPYGPEMRIRDYGKEASGGTVRAG